MRMHSIRLLLPALLLLAGSCTDVLHTPAPESPQPLSIRLSSSLSAGAGATLGEVFDKADRARVVVRHAGSLVVDTTLAFTPTTGETRLRISLDPRVADERVEVAVRLQRGDDDLFRGGGTARMQTSGTTSVDVSMEPVVAGVRVGRDVPTLAAIGATVRLGGAALFATGDTVPGARLGWRALDSGVVEVTPDGVATARAEGQVRVEGAFGEIADTVSLTVRAVVTRVVVAPPTTTLLLGATAQLTARAEDANGNPIMGRALRWRSTQPEIAAVDSLTGAVRGVGVGPASIEATVDGVTSSAAAVFVEFPRPVLESLSPGEITERSEGFALEVRGSGFVDRSRVHWNGTERPTQFDGPGQLRATISAADIAAAGEASVTVVTPQPGGGTSAARTFTIIALRTLTVAPAGTGSGTVEGSPGTVRCTYAGGQSGGICTEALVDGTTVVLTATPAVGSSFGGWSGAGETNPQGQRVVRMTEARSVTATFTRNQYALSVTRAGDGSGTVTSEPAGIACGEACSASFVDGTTVTLTAVPAVGSSFGGWSGPGTTNAQGQRVVSMTQAQSVTATFTRNEYTLEIITSGEGSVTASPARTTYQHGEVVELTATPATGWSFGGWSGDGTGSPARTVVMEGNRSVTATFTRDQYALSVSLTGDGSGVVRSEPAGIDCGAACSASFVHGTTVVLTATPNAGSTVTWSGGGGTADGNRYTVLMTQARSVTATFTRNEYVLSVSIAGEGTVTSEPAGIACGEVCSASYAHGTVVTLIPVPAPGSVFGGWGGTTGTTNEQMQPVVTMTEARNVTVFFTRIALDPTEVDFAMVAYGTDPAERRVSVTNGGGLGILSGLSVSIDYGDEAESGWLFADLDATTAPTALVLRATGDGVHPGVYTASVVVSSTQQGIAPQTVRVTFTVSEPVPVISFLNPDTVQAGGGAFTLSVEGTNFTPGSVVRWNGQPRPTTFIDLSLVQAQIPASDLQSPGTASVTVVNPAPGGGVSNGVEFVVRAPAALAVRAGGVGRGVVRSQAAGIDCQIATGSATGACQDNYPVGTEITLTATPTAGQQFVGWLNACAGSFPSCTVRMDSALTVIAVFDEAGSQQWPLFGVTAGGSHTCALFPEGGPVCWGENGAGQLGNGTTAPSILPTFTAPISGFVGYAASGGTHTCALSFRFEEGTPYCWGSIVGSTTPVMISAPSFQSIASGGSHTCGVTDGNEVFCWGLNEHGQLGNGTLTPSPTTPVRVVLPAQASVIALTAGESHTCALLGPAGEVYCWGRNDSGQLGDGTILRRTTPVRITGGGSFVRLEAGGNHTCAQEGGGELFCWGDNRSGQVGDGSVAATRTSPVRVPRFLSGQGVSALALGANHTCAVSQGGSFCWGANDSGQLGNGSFVGSRSPVFILDPPGGGPYVELTAGDRHTCGTVEGNGNQVFCWGSNGSGQLGASVGSDSATPVRVGTIQPSL